MRWTPGKAGCFSPAQDYEGVMRYLLSLATVCLFITPLYAGSVPSDNKDPFGAEAREQRQARKAEIRELEEREERAHDMKQQREVDHPEMDDDEHDEDLEE
jgi:hypothetical protein